MSQYILSDKMSLCPSCRDHPDSDMAAWRCKKAYKAIKLKQDLLNSLPHQHPSKQLEPDSDLFTIFCLDPESENLGCYRIFPRPPNYMMILSLTRRIAYYVHTNRAKALIPARLLQKEGFYWQTDKRREGRLNDVQKLIEVQIWN